MLKLIILFALTPYSLFASALYIELGQKSYLNKINRIQNSNYNYLRVLPRYYGETYSAYLDYYYYNNSAKDEGAKKMEVGGQKIFSPFLIADLALGKSSNHTYAPSFNSLAQLKTFIPQTKTSPYVAYIYESYKSTPVSRYHYYRLGAEQIITKTYSIDLKVEAIKNEPKRGFGISLDNFINITPKWRLTGGGLFTCLGSDYYCNGKSVDNYTEISTGLNYQMLPSLAINTQIFRIIQESKTSYLTIDTESYVFKLGFTYFF